MIYSRIPVAGPLSGALLLVAANAGAVEGSRFEPALSSSGGVVASVSSAAGAVGVAVLDAGGNAMDAAVATVFAVGVSRPDLCGIGGGGFLVYRGADGTVAALDFRETAPQVVTPHTFEGAGIHQEGSGHRPVGVPGTVAGMAAALQAFGTIPLAQAIAPAEDLARNGVVVTEELSYMMGAHNLRLMYYPSTAAIYLIGGVQPYPPGSLLIQLDYANSLDLIAKQGPDAFYKGAIAQRIVSDMETAELTDVSLGLLFAGGVRRVRAWCRAPAASYRQSRDFASSSQRCTVTHRPVTSGKRVDPVARACSRWGFRGPPVNRCWARATPSGAGARALPVRSRHPGPLHRRGGAQLR
ncbi:MAG: gamma-glutamyltransferase, partial [bacterium]